MSYGENDVRAAHGIDPASPIGQLPDQGEFVVGISEGQARPAWDKATPEQIRADLDEFAARSRERYRRSTSLTAVSIPPPVARVIGWDPAADGQMVIAKVGDRWAPVSRVDVEVPDFGQWQPPVDVISGFAKTIVVRSGWMELTRRMAGVLLGPDWVAYEEALEVWEGEGGSCA
jgi:hypothetical protein